MNYGMIKNCDIADGEGVRVTLFVSGCTNKCKGCFQPETWDFDYGKPFTKETEEEILKLMEPFYINGLTLLGGDPFEPSNQRALLPFIKKVKDKYPEKDIWAYTGFLYDALKKDGTHCRCEVTDELLSYIDILVDGPFIEEKKDITLLFRGSSNQRLINMRATRTLGEVVLWKK